MLAALAILASTATGEPPPPPAGDIIPGAAFVVLGTGVDVAMAKALDAPVWGVHFVPLLGPVLTAHHVSSRPCNGPHGGECGFARGYLYFQSAVNFAAAGVGGFFLVRGLVNAASPEEEKAEVSSLRVTPWVSAHVSGLLLGGRF